MQNHMVSDHTRLHDPECSSKYTIYRYTWYNASIHSPVPASGSRNAGKPATKRTNMLQTNQRKHEQTGTNQWYLIIKSIIKSSFQTDESWEEDHQHQPHGSSRPLPHPWAFPQQSDTLIDLMANPCRYHGYIMEYYVLYCMASYDISLPSLEL